MSLVTPSQSNSGDTIEASDINNPINQLAAVINGNIDATNITDGAVSSAKLATGAVTATKIDFTTFGKGTAQITNGTISGTSPSGNGAVTVTVGPSGTVLCGYTVYVVPGGSGWFYYSSVALSGTNTLSATASTNKMYKTTKSPAVVDITINVTQLITGLTPGSTVFTFNNWIASGSWTNSGVADALWVLAL